MDMEQFTKFDTKHVLYEAIFQRIFDDIKNVRSEQDDRNIGKWHKNYIRKQDVFLK